jgi:glycosyltransferase involved in cell wall biosynthesis
LPFRWVSFWEKRKEIKLNQQFHRVVVATDYMKQELLRNGFDAGRIEIHAPVPRTADVTLESSFSDRNLIVYAGQIIRGKGVDVLLESLAKVHVNFECLIAGEGSHKRFCEGLCRELGLAKRVTFTGYLPPEDLQNCYSEASVAVMSSLWPEPFGAAGLEAMRYGLPVVAFDAGGIKEWLVHGHNGFLVPRLNRAQFAARIEELLANKGRARQMGIRGRQFAREKFNFVQYIAGLERMFAEVIRETCPDRDFTQPARQDSALITHNLPQATEMERVGTLASNSTAAGAAGAETVLRNTDSAFGASLGLDNEH